MMRRMALVAALAVAGLAAQAGPLQAAEPQHKVEWIFSTGSSDLSTMAPGDSVTIWLWVDDIYRGLVEMKSHVGPYWDLYVCDARDDGFALSGRIDPGDGRVLPYYDTDNDPTTCYNRDIWYDVRKFRAAWSTFASPWAAPPPL